MMKSDFKDFQSSDNTFADDKLEINLFLAV